MVLLLAWTLVGPSPAPALPTSGLLPNPDFHEPEGVDGVAGWTELFELISEMNVLLGGPNDDADGCADSGALDAINTSVVDSGSTAYVGCTNDVTEGQAYRVTGAVRFPVGTDPSEFGVGLFFHSSLNCFGEFVGTGSATNGEYRSETTLDWTDWRTGAATAPETAKSIGVRLFLIKDLGKDNVSDVYVDRVYLTTADFIFVDDFERGSACRWSEEVGVAP